MWGKEDEGENGRRGEWESGKASTTFATAFATAFAKLRRSRATAVKGLRRSRATVVKESFGGRRALMHEGVTALRH